MPTCSAPPNRPPPEVIDRLIDDVAWAKTCLLVAAAASPGSPAREDETVPRAVIVELRVCELAIPKLEAGAVLRRQPTGAA